MCPEGDVEVTASRVRARSLIDSLKVRAGPVDRMGRAGPGRVRRWAFGRKPAAGRRRRDGEGLRRDRPASGRCFRIEGAHKRRPVCRRRLQCDALLFSSTGGA